MYTAIPESEISWLLSLDSEYKKFKSEESQSVYPVAILPPKLKKFVKSTDRYIDFVGLGPYGHSDANTPDGMEWRIWGWKELPSFSRSQGADWSSVIVAEKERPTIEDVQDKITRIQAELGELTALVSRL